MTDPAAAIAIARKPPLAWQKGCIAPARKIRTYIQSMTGTVLAHDADTDVEMLVPIALSALARRTAYFSR